MTVTVTKHHLTYLREEGPLCFGFQKAGSPVDRIIANSRRVFLLLSLIHFVFSSSVNESMCFPKAVMSAASGVAEGPERDEDVVKRGEQEGKGEALSLKWPETLRKQAVFLFLLPITFPLWLTLPDVRHLVRNSVCNCRTGGGILHKPTPLIFFLSFRNLRD